MPISVRCPECNKLLQVNDEYAGKKVRCNAPTCDGIVKIPTADETSDHIAAAAPPRPRHDDRPRRKRREIACPECGAMNHRREERCVECGAWLEEDDDSRIQHRALWKPCPQCGEEYADRVTWTPWGSFYGPALLSHVRCRSCKYAYNGKTGRSNMAAAILFVTVPLVMIIGIVVFLIYFLINR